MSGDKEQEILDFWFNEIERADWYRKDEAFDAQMRTRFLTQVEQALAGAFDGWAVSANGRLALILLLDQMTRNLFRDTPRAFAGDGAALALSQAAIHEGQLDKEPNVFRRIFTLMPLMHSENLDVQKQSVTLFQKYADERSSDYAQQHLEVIEKYGRFPHRNAILGRASTNAEKAYLAHPNAGF